MFLAMNDQKPKSERKVRQDYQERQKEGVFLGINQVPGPETCWEMNFPSWKETPMGIGECRKEENEAKDRVSA